MIPTSLSMTAAQHAALQSHLFPGDGLEAVALALCGRRSGTDRHRLVVRRIIAVPYKSCSVRLPDQVTWSTDVLPPLLEEASRLGLALVKIHGHSDYAQFSTIDNSSDRALFPSVYAWTESDEPHASAILMANGRMFGRVVGPDGYFEDLRHINVVGDDLLFWYSDESSFDAIPKSGRRVAQTFGAGTYNRLRKLNIGVVGCSGTGTPVIEQLARNCVGKLVLVDPDRVEEGNLNRMLNATLEDAQQRRPKVDVVARAVAKMGLGTHVETHFENLIEPSVVRAIAECDIVFGCMDTVDGRHLLNKLATFYSMPYFDLGVRIDADGHGSVEQVCGSVHYLQPGGSSLMSRHVYSLEQVQAAGLFRTDPEAYRSQLKQGYIRGVQEDQPAVIQLNSLIASIAVNELLARLHPYRLDPNGDYAVHRVSLSHGIYEHDSDDEPCPALSRHVGRGDIEPLLEWPELSVGSRAA
jgi:hypothetical protein